MVKLTVTGAPTTAVVDAKREVASLGHEVSVVAGRPTLKMDPTLVGVLEITQTIVAASSLVVAIMQLKKATAAGPVDAESIRSTDVALAEMIDTKRIRLTKSADSEWRLEILDYAEPDDA